MSTKNKAIGTHRTVILGDTYGFEVVYHETTIFRREGNVIRLNTGGYFTATTKRRMNQALAQSFPHLTVVQRGGDWCLVDNKSDAAIPFNGEGLTFTVGPDDIETAAGVC